MKKIAIVILNWNGKENTLECLESVAKLRTTNYELRTVVVDNGSTDGSVTALRNFQFPHRQVHFSNSQFKLIENKKNLGFTGGNNVGIKRALKDGAEYVVILNNDTILDENLIVQLVEIFEDDPGAGIVSPKIYFAPGFEFHKDRYKKDELGKVFWYAGGKIDWANILTSHRGVDEVDRGQYDKVVEIDYASGACVMVKSGVFKKIGLFDKDYFLYWEDADFCLRARKVGYKVLYAPVAHLWHKNAGSSRVGGPLHDYYLTRNRLLFGSKYANLRARFALLRESIKFLISGRPWQKRGVLDYYFGNLGKGSFTPN